MLHQLWLHERLLEWLGAVSVVMFVGSLLAVPWLIGRLPADYFRRPDGPTPKPADRHWLLHLVLMIAKNIVGAILLVMGIAMLFLPGQGILTILLALGLLDLPGKRHFECSLLTRPTVFAALNWLREKEGRPPFEK